MIRSIIMKTQHELFKQKKLNILNFDYLNVNVSFYNGKEEIENFDTMSDEEIFYDILKTLKYLDFIIREL